MDHNPSEPIFRQLVSVLAQNREDSYATQRKRGNHLESALRVVLEAYGLQNLNNLKLKHVEAVVDSWKRTDQGHRAIDEKLSHLRWLLGKIGKPNLLPRTNRELGLQPGPRHTRAGKIVSDSRFTEMLGKVEDERIRAMMMLARYLGLRFEEAALFRPWKDVDSGRVWVKRGTKGGQPRYLFLHHPRQSEALAQARSLVQGDHGLIPQSFETYEKWRQYVYPILREAGFSREQDVLFHDLRRTYIVERMGYLQKERHYSMEQSASLVAREVGHHRTEVLQWYMDFAVESTP